MASYKPIDLSKEGFRKYLDRKGVLDAMTKVLIKCNSERPENAIEFVIENLCETHTSLKAELHEAHQEIERLKQEISTLKVGGPNGGKKSPPEASDKQEKKATASPQNSAAAQTNGDDGEAVGVAEKQENSLPSTAPENAEENEPKHAKEPPATDGQVAPAPANETPEVKETNGGESK